MASANPFDLLVDDDNDDVSQLIQKLPPPVKKAPVSEAPAKAGKMPSKPLPPAQAVRESRSDGQRGGGRGGGRGTGRGRGGRFGRDSADNGNSYSNNGFSGGYRQPEEGDLDKSSERRGGYGGPRGGAPRGGRRGGFSNGDAADGERPRRVYERHSGTGRGNEFSKRDGAGRGNWGTPTDDIAPVNEEPVIDAEKNVDVEKPTEQEDAGEASKASPVTEPEEKEAEAKEMTLEEYEKVLEEKRKALLALKSEERKVTLDKDFESMQLLSSKKNEEEFFVKLGSDKDKRKDAEKEEKAKKALTINEFLKPAEGEKYYGPGRGRGRGRGPRGGYTGNIGPAPIIEDQLQFPTLGAK